MLRHVDQVIPYRNRVWQKHRDADGFRLLPLQAPKEPRTLGFSLFEHRFRGGREDAGLDRRHDLGDVLFDGQHARLRLGEV